MNRHDCIALRVRTIAIYITLALMVTGVMLPTHSDASTLGLRRYAFAKKQVVASRAKTKAPSLEAIDTLITQGDLLQARTLLKEFLEGSSQSARVGEAQQKLWDLNVAILLSPKLDEYSGTYTVVPGDSLSRIAKRHTTTVELLMQANNLKTDVIAAGIKLKVPTVTFNLLIDKSQNILMLKAGDEIFKVYRVATGKNNCTPTGKFVIVEKIVDPVWYKDGQEILPQDPRNILGTRWMEISLEGYGIHGTRDPQSIGTQSTAGCVRMHNRDVEELYKIIPKNTEVTIID